MLERCKKWVFEEGIRASGALFGFPGKTRRQIIIQLPTLHLSSLSFLHIRPIISVGLGLQKIIIGLPQLQNGPDTQLDNIGPDFL